MGKSRNNNNNNGPMFNSTNKNENKKQNLLSEFANSGKQQQQSESGKHDVDKFNSDNESDYGNNKRIHFWFFNKI